MSNSGRLRRAFIKFSMSSRTSKVCPLLVAATATTADAKIAAQDAINAALDVLKTAINKSVALLFSKMNATSNR